MIHALKIEPYYFEEVLSGQKTFEIRKHDRDFMVGDLLALNEFDPEKPGYTGRSVLVYVDFGMKDPKFLQEGYVVMSIKPAVVKIVNTPISSTYVDCMDYRVPLAPVNEILRKTFEQEEE